ncbi:MAG: rRNA maturation RNase YbeY [Kiritimatiellae bacterium]|nr:rRNA maturation RNase YbeY [Kiritimatiellia bacterium]
MNVTVYNHQRKIRLDRRTLAGAARRLASFAERRCAPEERPWRELVIHVLDDAGIAPVNQAVVGHEGATDVITQRYDPLPGEPQGLQGELFVNAQRAAEIAEHNKRWTFDRELALYIAHGCDHLTGADDHEPDDYARMRRRELRWLKRLGDVNFLCGGTGGASR